MKLKLLVLTLLALLTSGCQTLPFPTAGTETDWMRLEDVCAVWRPILASRRDVFTENTQAQIEGNNAAQEALCGVAA